MSFRFQKRVRIAPGLRLNISKRGISSSVGRRGASLTLGKRGLYGNVGLPGSGLSYRTKLDKTQQRSSNTWHQKETQNIPKTVSLTFDKQTHSLIFVDEDHQRVAPEVERMIKREFREDIQKLYDQKEQEINEQTTKLLELQQQILQQRSPEQFKEFAAETISFDFQLPNEKEIFEELKTEFEEELSFFKRIKLFLPSERQSFLIKVETEAKAQFQIELEQFNQAKEDYEEQRFHLLKQVEKVLEGHMKEMEHWFEHFLTKLDFPLETNISYQILSPREVYLDVDLPQIEEIPLTKASILKSGKLKIEKKSMRELREHYAIMVGGTALYLCSYAFSLLPTCETITISGYTQVRNEATGHLDDQYIYSLKVDKTTFYSLNIKEVHPIAAFDNFEPIINATKTYIFREITPYEPKSN